MATTIAIPAELKCPQCLDLVQQPVKLSCGHFACSACVQQIYHTEALKRDHICREFANTVNDVEPEETIVQEKTIVKQWASQVHAFSSQYSSPQWSAQQIIGNPKVYPNYGDNQGSWAIGSFNAVEYIDIGFKDAVIATTINIYETYNSGMVSDISVFNPKTNAFESVYTGNPAVTYAARIFSPMCAFPSYPIDRVKITVNGAVCGDYVELDAVELVGAKVEQKTIIQKPTVNAFVLPLDENNSSVPVPCPVCKKLSWYHRTAPQFVVDADLHDKVLKLPKTVACANECGNNAILICQGCSNCFLCQSCFDSSHVVPFMKKHKVHKMSSAHIKPCQAHGMDMDLFCTKCQTIICFQCKVYNGHESHTCVPLPKHAELCKKNIAKNLQSLESRAQSFTEMSAKVDKEKKALIEGHVALDKELDIEFVNLFALLEQKRNSLKQTSQSILNSKVTLFDEQRNALKYIQKVVAERIKLAYAPNPSLYQIVEADLKLTNIVKFLDSNPFALCSSQYHAKLNWKSINEYVSSFGKLEPLRGRPGILTGVKSIYDRLTNTIQVSWNEHEYAYYYVLESSFDDKNWKTIYTGPSNGFVVSGVLKANYFFRVCGSNMLVQGPWSATTNASSNFRFLCIACTDPHVSDMKASLVKAGCASETIKTINGNQIVPTLEQLLENDAVLLHSFQNLVNSDTYGDLFAKYVERGGRLVVTGFTSWPGSGWQTHLGGQFMQKGYHPLNYSSSFAGGTNSIMNTSTITNHIIMNGVTNFDGGSYAGRVLTTARNGAEVLASWQDGNPLVVVYRVPSLEAPIVALNFDAPSCNGQAGFWDPNVSHGHILLYNSLMFVAGFAQFKQIREQEMKAQFISMIKDKSNTDVQFEFLD